MTKFVRVRDRSTGHELSVPAEAARLNPKAYSVLSSEDAVTRSGEPLAPKYAKQSKSESGQKTADEKKGA